jgi:hypothetical protein
MEAVRLCGPCGGSSPEPLTVEAAHMKAIETLAQHSAQARGRVERPELHGAHKPAGLSAAALLALHHVPDSHSSVAGSVAQSGPEKAALPPSASAANKPGLARAHPRSVANVPATGLALFKARVAEEMRASVAQS